MKSIFLCVLTCLVLSSLTNSSKAQNILLWNGETSNIIDCEFNNGQADNTFPNSGNWGFKGSINQWKAGTISLKCQDTWRIDLSNYSEIRFYIKTDMANAFLKFGLSSWPHSSTMVDIAPYVENGPINSDYKLVKIPIESLKNENCQLNSVEQIRFETSGTDIVTIWADDFEAVDLIQNKIDSISFLSDQVIKLNLKDRYTMEDVQQLTNYEIISSNDPEFVQGANPVKVGRHFFVKEFPEFSTNPITKNELFLILDRKLKKGQTYQLSVTTIKDLSGNDFDQPQTFNFTFDDQKLINHSVKVNQIGYFTWGPKYGYVGNYLGDAGPMTITPTQFKILHAKTNETVLTGIPEFKANDPERSGEVIFECDFSSFNTPGEYYLYVPGIGRSFDFEVSENVLDSAYYTSARGLFYQRCGMDLVPPYADARWAHPACHQNDGISHSSWLNSPLYNGELINQYIPAKYGWHDAGDYGKYTVSGCSAVYYLLNIFDLFPDKFGDKELNIPESGNGVPDILDEAKYELSWLMNMQAADGGVFERVTTVNWPTTMPQNDLATRYISEKTTAATAQFAAVMAMAHRLFLAYEPDFANQCLNKSKLALNFLVEHPDVLPVGGYNGGTVGIGGGNYSSGASDIDERAWAVAELYKSTGDPYYHQLFDTYWSPNPPNWGWNPFLDHQINASITYATTTKYPTDPVKIDAIKSVILGSATNKWINRLSTSFYRSACGVDIGLGAYGQSSRYSWDLIMAYALSGDEKYRKYALLSLDVQLGNNPQNKSYITGVGSNYPMHPLHHPSLHDGVNEPVPGIPVFGPCSHLGWSNPYNIIVQDPQYLYPSGEKAESPYPILRRYYDIPSNPAMSEFNVIDEAITSSVLGFFKTVPLQGTINKPITKLNYFVGKPIDDKVLLKWEMASEFQVISYQVERSFDGVNFTLLASVNSWGDSTSPQHYVSTDGYPPAKLLYYRLRVNQKDGSHFYSTTIPVNRLEKKQLHLKLYPNPVTDKVQIEISDPSLQNLMLKWNVMISDVYGKMFYEGFNDVNTINDEINQLLDKLPPDIYIIEFRNQDETIREKFIKK